MVGSDWNQNRDLVERFNELGKKSILLQSEGMFLDNDQWYVRTVPVSKLLCLWGGVHKDIFRRRGYRGEISVTGAPRLDVYHKFNPSLSREEVYRRLSLDDIGRPYIVYLGQYFNEAEWGKELYEGQIALTEFACETPSEYYALVKCHPQEDKNNFFSREELCARRGGENVRVTDRGGHTESVEITTLLYYAAGVVSFSSTASIEAALLGRPSFIHSCGMSSPLQNGKMASLPEVRSIKELIQGVTSQPDLVGIQPFIDAFLPGPIDGTYTRNAADAIALYLRTPEPGVHAIETKECGPMVSGSNSLSPTQSADAMSELKSYELVAIKAHERIARFIMESPELEQSVLEEGRKIAQQRLATDLSKDYYQRLHENDHGFQTNNWLVSEADQLMIKAPRSVVEIGCGNGRFLKEIAPLVEVAIGVDWARSPLMDDCPNNVKFHQANVVEDELPSGDLICSADVLEHFDPSCIKDVIKKVHFAGRWQYHVIACYHDGHSHLTIIDPGAWLALFRHCSAEYRIRQIRPRRGQPDQLVCVIANF
jgi:SAM-dependent methyltransferase